MNEDSLRQVDLTRLGLGSYRATNLRGGTLDLGTGEDDRFTPVELLLAAIAGCGAIDVDFITVKRSEPEAFDVHVEATKVRDDVEGNVLRDIEVTYSVTFPEGEAGDRARGALPRAVRASEERLCTVSRTVQVPTAVAVRLVP